MIRSQGGGGSSGSSGATTQLIQKWRSGVARVRAKTGNARIVVLGTSIEFGAWANGLSTGDYFPNAWPTQLAKILDTQLGDGVPVFCNNWFGDGITTSQVANDSRVTLNTWVQAATSSLGGKNITSPGATGNAMSFGPIANVDTFEWYGIGSTNSRPYSLQFNAEAAVNHDTIGATRPVLKVPLAGTLGSATLKILQTGGGFINPVGVIAYDSTTSHVQVINAGSRGSKIADLVDNTQQWSPLANYGVFGADLFIIGCNVNDEVAGTTLATFISNYQLLITTLKALGADVMLMTEVPSGTNAVSIAQQQIYISAVLALAASNNLVVVDTFGRFVDFATANGLGLMAADAGQNLHPNGLGYGDIAWAVSKPLLAI